MAAARSCQVTSAGKAPHAPNGFRDTRVLGPVVQKASVATRVVTQPHADKGLRGNTD
jgi:hypothetical protein